jgi:tetratricopeptide (TPR) repeat protein
MPDSPQHQWIHSDQRVRHSGKAGGRHDWPGHLLAPVNAHRRLRGPYTAAGTIMRALVPAALASIPELVRIHQIEILSVAPELASVVPSTRETLTSLAVPSERTRYYSPQRTLRLAHGLTEFLRDYAEATCPATVSLVLGLADQADQTDQDLITVLLRRLDPHLVTLVVQTGPALEEGPLAAALARFAERVPPPAIAHAHPSAQYGQAGTPDLAAAYVASDCTEDDPAMLAAYRRLPALDRHLLHDARAAELAATGEYSWRLGAIPYHLEHGSSPATRAVEALAEGVNYCTLMGFYHAALDMGGRGRSLVEPTTSWTRWWMFTTRMATSLAVLHQAVEAERLYEKAKPLTSSAQARMQIAYGTAMLYTRHHKDDVIDHQRALSAINEAITLAEQIPDAKERVFNVVFNENGRALIEHHLGHPQEALRLISAGFARLDQILDPGEHQLHRSVLRHNRAHVYTALGLLEEAAEDFRAVTAADPNYPEYHFDLGNLLRRQGNDEAALYEYETAIRLSPPFPEVFYNRADTRAACGDLAGALADFEYVLELDPEHIDAHVNRAGLLVELGDAEAARAAAEAGLSVAPRNAHLLCVLGRLELEAGDLDGAAATLDASLAADPLLESAWATRAALAFENGDPSLALDDLSKALEIRRDAAMLYNRGAVHEVLGNWIDAITDFSDVIALESADADAWLRRAVCRSRIGDSQGTRADVRRFLTLAPGRAAETAGLLRSEPVTQGT